MKKLPKIHRKFRDRCAYMSYPMKRAFSSLLLLLAASASAQAQLGTVWHVPAETRPSGVYPSGMRDPLNPGTSASVTFYQGVYKATSGGNNQTGGTFFYRIGSGSWQTNALSWHANEPGDGSGFVQIWKSTVTMPASAGTLFEYYFATTFDSPFTSPTYIYNNGGTATTATQATAAASPFSFNVTAPVASASFTVTTPSTGTLNASYTTSKLYLNEVLEESNPITITFAPGVSADEVELWTNLNNRDRAGTDADGDGIHDGILPPAAPNSKPGGYTSGIYPTNGYFYAIPLTGSGGTYTLTTNAIKTGAYRLTGRYKISGQTNWTWFSGKDHCITVAPKLARSMQVYEINVFNVNATTNTFAGRSTLESLSDTNNGRVNLASLRNLGVNTLWFQPVHPNGIEGREPSGGWGSSTPAYDPGSPYAVKNFFEINELMTTAYNGGSSLAANRTASMLAFSNFVAAADARGMHVMLDAPFNHTAYDCEVSTPGLPLFAEAGLNTSGWNATDQIKNREARFYSSAGAAGIKYAVPASSASDVANAPDRNDFGKWNDVKDVFFGRYATLVTGDPDAETSRNTVAIETDFMNYDDLRGGAGSNGAVTRAVWKYFARYVPYWLEKTGLPAGSSKALQEFTGIDGLRADFGQGMPPQFWEYCINVARAHKWNFVFMTESLDGGAVTYRSNRHFDILNENIVFPWKGAGNTTGHRGIFEERRNSYGQGLVLLNNTSHDEAGYDDPWQAFIRYAVGSTIDGAPMIMYGQEIGTSSSLSFHAYELNFGKFIPHFKAWNSMQPQWTSWSTNGLGVKNLIPAYSGAGKAREFSPALRSSGRWFLNPVGSSNPDENIFAVAKYEEANASPAAKDVVLSFVNLNRSNTSANTFGIPAGLGTLLGIKSSRTYNVRNIAAYLGPNNDYPDRRSNFLWGSNGLSGASILSSGIYVSLPGVPSSDVAWGTNPFEPQYLKLYDVTPPPTVSGTPSVTPPYTVPGSTTNFTANGTATISWATVTDSEGLVPTYRVSVKNASGFEVSTQDVSSNSASLTGLASGDTYTFTVTALNPNDPSKSSAASATSGSIVSLNPSADDDGDGMSNAAELVAGTNPKNNQQNFVASATRPNSNSVNITWNPIAGRSYRVEASTNLTSSTWGTLATNQTSGSFTENSVNSTARFYRVVVE
jgi:Bacterial TSP3 repeat/Fibronectin type III domain